VPPNHYGFTVDQNGTAEKIPGIQEQADAVLNGIGDRLANPYDSSVHSALYIRN
jgi:hypothetical protein